MAFASSSVMTPPSPAAENSSSTEFIALRTSPPQEAEICRTTPSASVSGVPRRAFIMSTARRTAPSTSRALTGLNSNTVERLRIALNTQKYGFSVVEAMSVMRPSSMNSSSDCCCFLLKYWISSRYSSTPPGVSMVSSSAIICLMSAIPAVVALSLRRLRLVRWAMMRATVVFPVPEGP